MRNAMKTVLLLACMMIANSVTAEVSNQATARFADHESQPDTDPNSAFWRGAPGVNLTSDNFGKPAQGYESEVRAQWTRENLYFLFICPYRDLNLKPDHSTVNETYGLWNWDVAEVFIGSDFKDISRYKEFELSPQGEWVDLDIDLNTPHHEDGWKWNSGFEVAARVDAGKKVWYGFMRIPYRAVDSRAAAPGNELRINFYRGQGANHQLIAWQPTHKPTFHAPEAFGTLKLLATDPTDKTRSTAVPGH
jgi:hypothetical protein